MKRMPFILGTLLIAFGVLMLFGCSARPVGKNEQQYTVTKVFTDAQNQSSCYVLSDYLDRFLGFSCVSG